MGIKVRLNGKEVDFLIKMTGIKNSQEAAQRFLKIMEEEGIPGDDLVKVIDHCMKAWDKKYD